MTKEAKNLFPTELGEVVNDIMKNYFSEIVDVDFTANMEKRRHKATFRVIFTAVIYAALFRFLNQHLRAAVRAVYASRLEIRCKNGKNGKNGMDFFL